MGDTCTAEWADIMKLFADVATLDEFKQANKSAQAHYISSISPATKPEPVEEITGGGVIADEVIYTGAVCAVFFTGASSTRFTMPDESTCKRSPVISSEMAAADILVCGAELFIFYGG